MRRRRHAARAFTLIELMIVVAVIVLIVALAVPSFLTSRMRANEGVAVANLMAIRNACQTYYSQGTPHSYPADMTLLTTPATTPPYIDPLLAGAAGGGLTSQRQGYVFTYAPTLSSGAVNEGFTIQAGPAVYGRTGLKSFYADETGIVTATTQNQPANAGDAQVN